MFDYEGLTAHMGEKFDYEEDIKAREEQRTAKRVRITKQRTIRDIYDAVSVCTARSLCYMSNNLVQISANPYHNVTLTRQYRHDDRAWRAWFRSFVHNLSTVVPSWQPESLAYLRVYHVVDQIIFDYTDKRVRDFQRECYRDHFRIVKANDTLPEGCDMWRRIHLLACSPFWQTIAAQAIHRMAALAAQDEAARLGVDSVIEVLPDRETCYFPPVSKEFLAKAKDITVRREREEYERRYNHD